MCACVCELVLLLLLLLILLPIMSGKKSISRKLINKTWLAIKFSGANDVIKFYWYQDLTLWKEGKYVE